MDAAAGIAGAATSAADTGTPIAAPCPGVIDGDLTVALHPEPASVRIARDLTGATVHRWQLGELCDSTVLVVSELITNAVVHGAPLVEGASGSPCPPARWLLFLRLVRGPRGLMCLVTDPSDREPVRAAPDGLTESGYGLHIVAARSRRWGWARCHGGGKMVWALFG